MKFWMTIIYLIIAPTGLSQQPDLWVTLETTRVSHLKNALADQGIAIEIHTDHPDDEIAVARINRADLPTLTNIFHDTFKRCGGYRVHETLAEAKDVNCQLQKRRLEPLSKGVSYTIDNSIVANTMLDITAEDHIISTITNLSSFDNRFYDSSEGVAASDWLRDHWASLMNGRNDATVTQVSHTGFPQKSVILSIEGSELPGEVVVLGGHLDTTLGGGSGLSPGADDDASGIATITEVIRVIAETGFRPRRTVRFMGYAGEEHGLLGSEDIADSYEAQSVDVIAVLQLDMTNYHGSVEDIWLMTDYTDNALTAFGGQLIDTYLGGVTRSTTRCGYPCSDHASWYFAGYPTLMPAESRFGEHNPNLHTPGDTLAVSGGQATHALKFARLATVFVAEIAKGDIAGVGPTSNLGRVNLLTLTSLMQGFGPCGTIDCPRDLNDDNQVGQADLDLLLSDWRNQRCLGFIDGEACP